MEDRINPLRRLLILLLIFVLSLLITASLFIYRIPGEIKIFSDEIRVISLPLKDVVIKVIPEVRLVPGGQSVGVKMDVKGVLVVGLEEIETAGGKTVNPCLDAGLEIGDSILAINGIKVDSATEVKSVINQIQGDIRLKVNRKSDILYFTVTPVKAYDDNQLKIGVWVRDKTAGLGTLTYFNPETKVFGALGHAITDPDTGDVLAVRQGELLSARVESVKHGEIGMPGEIRGIFYEAEQPLGKLETNTIFGVFGIAYQGIENIYYPIPLSISYANEVKTGPAYILTTLNENKMGRYKVYIEKVNHQSKPGTKGMVIRVTDETLLNKTGGIVQGMSGSPVIQDGKLIGAVTHVFVNDPKKGYGIFVEWMLKESGL
jgi:stage IV sporulation protein B